MLFFPCPSSLPPSSSQYREKVSFASGGLAQQFIVNSKGWFSFQDNVLHAGEGPIHAIRWKGVYIMVRV